MTGFPKAGMPRAIARAAQRWLPSIGIAACLLLAVAGEAKAADTIKGKRIYDTQCALCHGGAGRSTMPGAPDLNRRENMLKPDLTLLAAIRNGRNAMPAFQGILTDRDIMDVIAYLRTLH